jgi:hypothetical protein
MAIDLDDAFETDSLLLGQGTTFAGVIATDEDPSVSGQAAPMGSFAMRTTGQHYKKIGAGDTDWKETDSPNELIFVNRAGAAANIAIVDIGINYVLTFFNRAAASEDIVIV